MTIQEALRIGRQRLARSDSPELDARLLLAHVLQTDHPFLVAHGETNLNREQELAFQAILDRASLREPIPYLTGQAPFCGSSFAVTPAVLIPRPETEHLVELVLAWAQNRQVSSLVDVGTGSGCIAVTLARHLTSIDIDAVDISSEALAVARQNARIHGVQGRLRFHHGHLLTPVPGPFDAIVANLPYVADSEWSDVGDSVKMYEPDLALRGGAGGLDLVRELLVQAKNKLAVEGAVFLEIGWRQGQAGCDLVRSILPLAQVELLTDFAGLDRIIVVTDVGQEN